MKKIWIIVAILAAALAALVVLRFTAKPETKFESGDDTSLYPYSFELKGKDLLMSIGGELPENYAWVNSDQSAAVAVSKEKVRSNQTTFRIHPEGTGIQTLMFYLENEQEGQNDRIFEISVTVVAGRDKKLSVMYNSHREMSGMLRGEWDGISYVAAPQPDGTIQMSMVLAEDAKINVDQRGDSVYVKEKYVDKTHYNYSISYDLLGQSIVYFVNGESEQALQLIFSTDLLENVTIVSHEVVDYFPEEPSFIQSDFGEVYGSINLPDLVFTPEAEIVSWNSGTVVGQVGFSMAGRYWMMYLSDEMDAMTLAAGKEGTLTDSFVPQEVQIAGDARAVNTVTVTPVTRDGSPAAIWNMDGRAYLLIGREAAAENLLSAAESIIKAVNNG